MSVHFATPAEIATWDELVLANSDGGEFFQMQEFADIKRLTDWREHHILVDNLAVLALEKSVLGIGKLWYIQKGPGVVGATELDEVLTELKKFAVTHKVFCIKFEPPFAKPEMLVPRADVVPTPRRTQPTYSTIWLDIAPNEDVILASFNTKARYNIRQAIKAGVTCRSVESTDENCQKFYNLFIDTAAGRFPIRSFEYYKTFWQSYCTTGHGKLFFAECDGALVSADFVMIHGKKASRKDAASPRQKSVRGAAALLELEVIKQLKPLGVTAYDLCGTPASDQIKNADDPLYGVGQFKSGFSAIVTDYVGCFDLIVKPQKYKQWVKIGERLAQRWRHWRYSENWY